jgi:hypothetical protein
MEHVMEKVLAISVHGQSAVWSEKTNVSFSYFEKKKRTKKKRRERKMKLTPVYIHLRSRHGERWCRVAPWA